jgi:hypothetical protein
MSWRWSDPDVVTISNGGTLPDNDLSFHDLEAVSRGYCGLAGKP